MTCYCQKKDCMLLTNRTPLFGVPFSQYSLLLAFSLIVSHCLDGIAFLQCITMVWMFSKSPRYHLEKWIAHRLLLALIGENAGLFAWNQSPSLAEFALLLPSSTCWEKGEFTSFSLSVSIASLHSPGNSIHLLVARMRNLIDSTRYNMSFS